MSLSNMNIYVRHQQHTKNALPEMDKRDVNDAATPATSSQRTVTERHERHVVHLKGALPVCAVKLNSGC